ncbi:hypothetical protein KKC08_02730 [Patescibacteria group bacterium]|nr:hypothetical protein [Patescibacteria group bacterium]MCG2702736.1 hypothetical protein [Candidatus Parcubacteria bacterium]MBU4265436.1 hypothetical protein [Patescibacteria group bacterium]MBU4390486.1 hypothetical protein [Patescibacteria group bacterium]MBU4397053.1 hypothetical protein [Patescibacteria group bacterium]
MKTLIKLKTNPAKNKNKKTLFDLAKKAKSLGKSNIVANFDKYLPKNLQ